ncbi:SCO family protein [Pseudomonadota bacterium]
MPEFRRCSSGDHVMGFLLKFRVRVFSLAIFAILLAGLSNVWEASTNASESGSTSHANPSTSVRPFSLTDHTGRQVTERDFIGKFLLVYFGFTYCPDVCPTGLHIISSAVEQLRSEGKNIIPVFITVDPERDSPSVMATYVKFFHPRLIGLTGNTEQIANIANIFSVRYSKVFTVPPT